MQLSDLQVKIFADGADLNGILRLAQNPLVQGFTTNPSLMRKAGVTDYTRFAHQVLEAITDRPISFEVFSDELDEMEAQARKLKGWGENVYVKIPVTNSRGESTAPLIRKLTGEGVKLNITALLTPDHVRTISAALKGGAPSVVSVFAGRIADTGVDPLPIMQESLDILKETPTAELLWASCREVFNIFQADTMGCHIITVTHDILGSLGVVGKDLTTYSIELIKVFYNDAQASGFKVE
ncbi:MAG: transaldolase [Chloroflexi bacterium]|nr:transaldolase [Chloroflexota bacterium]MCC6895494.1 transaldolase [Anaerolineae bacterium]